MDRRGFLRAVVGVGAVGAAVPAVLAAAQPTEVGGLAMLMRAQDRVDQQTLVQLYDAMKLNAAMSRGEWLPITTKDTEL